MYVKRLSLSNFRNYSGEEITFLEKTNLLYGDNAQGKTNALEALYLFSIGKSFRTTQDKDLIRFGMDNTKITLVYSDQKRENSIEIIIRNDRKKQIKVNGVVISKLSELVGRLNVVLFCPEELSLIKEGPGLRRRFIDIAISQLRPNYYYMLGKYNKVLEQRNHLIRSIKYNNAGCDTLFVWNEKLVQYGMELIEYRKEFVKRLGDFAKPIHFEIAGEELLVEYKPRFDSKEQFLEKLCCNTKKEIENGYTLYGPHRDDIDIIINGLDAKTFGSQGQQRSAVLSLKLAQADLIFDETEEYPILLLDDIMSELDLSRRKYLVKKIHNKQVIITCTDIDSMLVDDTTNLVHIQNGAVIN